MREAEEVQAVFETGVVKERLYVLVKQLHHSKIFNWPKPIRRVLETVESNLLLKKFPFDNCLPTYSKVELPMKTTSMLRKHSIG